MRADDFVIHEWEKEKWDEYENIQRYIDGFKKGFKESFKEAKEKEYKEKIQKNNNDIIKKMLENNLDLNVISKITGKSVSQIKNIQKQMTN